MATRRRIGTTAVLIYLLSLHHFQAFSFSAPNPAQSDNYNLADAVRALRLRDAGYGSREYDDRDLSLGVSPSDKIEFTDYLNRVLGEYRASGGDRGFKGNIKTADIEGNMGELIDDNQNNNKAVAKELDTIFDKDNDETKEHTPDMPLQIPLHTQSNMKSKKSGFLPPKYLDLSGLDVRQAKQIVAKVEELKKTAEQKELSEKGANENKEVSQDELNEVFSDLDDKDNEATNGDGETREKKVAEQYPEKPTEEQKISAYSRLFDNQKTKRSTSNQIQRSIPRVSLDLKKLFDIVAKLRLKERLESQEINFLSDSLNDATSSQVHQSLDGLQGELSSIEKAIEVERALEKVDSKLSDNERQYLDILSAAYLEDEKSQQGDTEKESKRGDTKDESANSWDGDGADSTAEVADVLSKYTVEKALEDIQNEAQDLEDSDTDEIPPPPRYTGDTPEKTYTSNESDESDADNVRRLLRRLEEDRLAQANSERTDTCPEIESLSDDCAMADKLGVDVDDEARGLCSRHQACYACSWTLKKSKGQCDDAYAADAEMMCAGDDECTMKALAFLGIERTQHRVGSRLFNACLSQCVVDYIYGVADRI